MKNFKYIFMLPVAACLYMFSSCSNEDYLGGHYVTDGAGVVMNVTATAPEGTAWVADDMIGVSTSYGNYDITARNRAYSCGTDGKTFVQVVGDPIYVKGLTNIIAYYPFTGTDGAEPIINLNTLDQTAIVDYYFAVAEEVTPATGSHVNLEFKNALSTLQLNITTPAGETIKGVRLSGFSHQAEVDPYTLDMKLSDPEDLVVEGDNIRTLSLKLIPQTIGEDALIPARLVLVGSIRSYSINLGEVALTRGVTQQGNIDVTDGVGSLEFVPGGSAWTDSGLGSDISF